MNCPPKVRHKTFWGAVQVPDTPSFYIQPRWSRVGGNILYTTSLDNDIFIQTVTDKESSATTLGLSAKAAKTFRTANLYLAVSGSVRRTSYDLLVGDCMSEAHTTSSSATLTYSTKPMSILSIEGNSTVLLSRQANTTMPQCSAGSTTSWEHSLSLHLYPTERWIVSVANDLYHSSDKQIPTNYFLNASVTYHRKKYELCLTANNILGTSRYETRQITSTVERYSTIRLRPRDILLRVSFDI